MLCSKSKSKESKSETSFALLILKIFIYFKNKKRTYHRSKIFTTGEFVKKSFSFEGVNVSLNAIRCAIDWVGMQQVH